MILPQFSTVVGTPNEKCWSQAQSWVKESGERVGVVVQVTQMDKSELVDLASIGTAIIESAKEKGGGVGTMPIEVGEGLQVSVVEVELGESTLTVRGSGAMVAYVWREGQLAKLGGDVEIRQGITGELHEGDRVMVATEQTIQLVGLPSIREILAEGEGNDASLAPKLHGVDDSSAGAALLITVGAAPRAGMMEQFKKKWERPIRVKQERVTPRKINLKIAGLALLLLIILIGIGMVKRRARILESEYAQVNNQITQQLDEAGRIADLNPDRAKSLLAVAGEAAASYQARVKKEPYKSRANELVKRVGAAKDAVFKVNKTTLTPTVELLILADGLQSSRMYVDTAGTLLFPDTSQARVVGMNLADKSRVTYETGPIGPVRALGLFDKKIYGVGEPGVVEIAQDKDQTKVVIEPDELWGEITEIESFAGNIYLFDRGNSEIWKYPVITDGFGDRRRWLGAGITLDLSKVVQMRVAGDIWIITSSGKLERYSRGVPVEFAMEGLPTVGAEKLLDQPSALYVTEELVYVVEAGAKRIVVFDMEGKYRSQYENGEFARASDVVVYEGKGYVLVDNVVKEFSL